MPFVPAAFTVATAGLLVVADAPVPSVLDAASPTLDAEPLTLDAEPPTMDVTVEVLSEAGTLMDLVGWMTVTPLL